MPIATPDVITLTRSELYEQVWSTPMRKLAATYSLSDVGLAKICESHQIPRPPRGYWAKKEFGKAPPRTPLPRCNDPQLQHIRLSRGELRDPGSKPKPPEPEYDPDVMEVFERARALPHVTVATVPRNFHSLVQATKDALGDAKANHHNLVHPPQWDKAKVLSISVSEASVRRSLAFLDALIKSVERVGGKVEVEQSQWKRETTVSFCGEQVATIRLRERYKQEPRKVPPKYPWDWQKYDFIPTGRLVLDSGYCEQVHCQDTEKGRRIEDAINALVVRWVAQAGKNRIVRRRADEEKRRREEEDRLRREREAELHRRRQELQEKQNAEQARVAKLIADAAAWRQSRIIREYILEVEQAALADDGRIEEGGELARWLEWARQQADRLDPFKPSPPSVLDERI